MELQNLHNINNIRIENALQTNGYHLDREWADFFVKNNYLVGVSLDGRPKQHDSYRKNIQGNGTFVQVMKNIEMLQKAGVDFNILSVVNNRTAPDIKKAYKFFRKNHLDYLQFIACLDPLGEVPGQRTYSLTPEVYGQFLMDLFHLWYEDLKNSRQPYIRQFENYIAILTGQMPESCDMVGICGMQYVVEADGSTYPCDFYVTEKYLLGNLNVNTIEEIDREREAIAFIKNSIQRNEACEECRYVQICRGGCRRTRIIEAGHRQYFCKSYQMFFDACLPDMIEIAQRLNHGAYSAHT